MASIDSLSNEIISLILSFGTIEDLLLSFQLVNKRFSTIIQTTPAVLKQLTFMPSNTVPESRPNDMRAEHGVASEKLQDFRQLVYKNFMLNPLIHWIDLLQLFTAYRDEHDDDFQGHFMVWDRGWSRNLVSKTPWLADSERRRKWLRKDASWRKLLLCCQNEYTIRRLDLCSQAFNLLEDDCSNYRRRGFIEFGNQTGQPTDAMTLGDLYDLLTIPSLGLFRKDLKHSLAWKLRLGESWASGKTETYDPIHNRACIHIYHVSEDGRDENYKYERPEHHGIKLQQEPDGGNNTKSGKTDDLIESFAVQDWQSVVESGRLQINWEDEYFAVATQTPEKYATYAELPSKYGPDKIDTSVMLYPEHARHEWALCKEQAIHALRLAKEHGITNIEHVPNLSRPSR